MGDFPTDRATGRNWWKPCIIWSESDHKFSRMPARFGRVRAKVALHRTNVGGIAPNWSKLSYKGSHIPICAFTGRILRRSPEKLEKRAEKARMKRWGKNRWDGHQWDAVGAGGVGWAPSTSPARWAMAILASLE